MTEWNNRSHSSARESCLYAFIKLAVHTMDGILAYISKNYKFDRADWHFVLFFVFLKKTIYFGLRRLNSIINALITRKRRSFSATCWRNMSFQTVTELICTLILWWTASNDSGWIKWVNTCLSLSCSLLQGLLKTFINPIS